MFQVIQVEIQSFQHFFHGIRVAIVQGRIRGDTRADLVKISVPGIVLHDLVDVELSFRSWSDESHVSFDHVPQLRQFVQVVFAQISAYFGHALVVLVSVELWSIFLRIDAHATEFVNGERSAEAPDSFLFEDYGSAVFTLNQEITKQKQR